MKTIDIEFLSSGLTLFGRLHLPDEKNPPLVVGSHGLEGSRRSAKQMVLAKLLPEQGIAFFRFDHRGCGESQGNFVTDTSLDKRVTDLTSAVSHLMALGVTQKKLGLFGSSMGGAACIKAWAELEALGFPPLGGVLCASPVISTTISNIPTQANGSRPVLPLTFFAENLLFNLSDEAKALHHLLIFHGDADEVVPVSNARRLFKAVQSPKELVLHENGSHQMKDPLHQRDFETRVVPWFQSVFKQV